MSWVINNSLLQPGEHSVQLVAFHHHWCGVVRTLAKQAEEECTGIRLRKDTFLNGEIKRLRIAAMFV